MNALKCRKFSWKNLQKNLKHFAPKNAKAFATGSNLIDIQFNSKTGVATVAMKRPPVNSLNLELVTELSNAMMEIEKNKGRGLILTSALNGIFTSGLDIMEFIQPNADRLKAYWTALQDMWLNLYSSVYPTAAAISGHSPGAGCLIACSCDYRVMVEGKYGIGLNETQFGLVAPSWFVDTFRNVLPKRESEKALISGKLFQVDEALKVGLIDDVATDNNKAVEKAAEYIASLNHCSFHAMAQTKLTIRYDAIKRLQDNREQDLRVFIKFVTSPEVQKGLEIYLASLKEKKK